MKTLLLAALLLAPGLARAEIIGTVPAISSEESLGRGVEDYLKRFRSYKARVASAPPAEAPNAALGADTVAGMLNKLFEEQRETSRPARALAERIEGLDNGGSYRQQLQRKLLLTAGGLEASGAGTYNAFVAGLLTTYLGSPEDRDGIVLLLQEAARLAAARPPQSYINPVYQAAYDGAFLVYPFVFLWDWRGGPAGLRKDAQGLFSFAMSRSRGLFAAPAGGAAAAAPAGSAASGGTRASLGQALAGIAQEARRRVAVDPAQLNLKQSFYTFGSQMMRSFAIGGTAGALYGLNEASEPVKGDPLLALEGVQDFVAANLELKVLRFRAQVASLLAEYAGPSGAPDEAKVKANPAGLETRLKQLVDAPEGLNKLNAELRHLQKHAKRLNAQTPFPRILADLEAELLHASRFHWGESPEKVRAQLILSSDKLEFSLRILGAEIERAKAARRLGPGDPFFVSLTPIAAGLSVAELQLAQLAVLLPPAAKPPLPSPQSPSPPPQSPQPQSPQ